MIQTACKQVWIRIAIEPVHKSVLGIHISEERNMVCSRKFHRNLVNKYGKHTVYRYCGIWYPQACNFLRLKRRLHSPLEKNLIERVMQYIKDR